MVEQSQSDCRLGRYENGQTLKEQLELEAWDFITIQQASAFSFDVKSYWPYAQLLADFIRNLVPGAELLLHQTWAYRSDDPWFSGATSEQHLPRSQRQMYSQLREAYQSVADKLQTRILPVGDAFYLAGADARFGLKKDTSFDPQSAKELELPRDRHSLHAGWLWEASPEDPDKLQLVFDGHHASAAGMYLAGCVFYEIVFGDSVVENQFTPAELDPQYARFLRRVAHESVERQRALEQRGRGPNKAALVEAGLQLRGELSSRSAEISFTTAATRVCSQTPFCNNQPG